jgi:hypothetical protein
LSDVFVAAFDAFHQLLDDAGRDATGNLSLIHCTNNGVRSAIVNLNIQERPNLQLRDYRGVW